MRLIQFLKQRSHIDDPVGTLSMDALRDPNLPKEKTDSQILIHIETQATQHGLNEYYEEFKKEFENQK